MSERTYPDADSREPAGHGHVTAFLAQEYALPDEQARAWARLLVGLPWRYVPPLVRIAVNTKNHPALTLAAAAAYSEDQEFKAAAKAHLDTVGELS